MHIFKKGFLQSKSRRIIDKSKDLIFAIKQIILKKKLPPTRIQVEVTNICNANCIFCAYQFYKAKKQTMTMETLNKVAAEIKELGIKNIDMTPFAGEIFTDKDIMKKIEVLKSCNPKRLLTYSNLIDLRNTSIPEILNSGITDLHISSAPLDEDLFRKIFRNVSYKQYLQNLIDLLTLFKNTKSKTLTQITIEFRSPMPIEKCIELPDFKNNIAELLTDEVSVGARTVFDNWMGVIKGSDLLPGMTIAKSNGKKIIPCDRLNSVQVLSSGDMRVCGCRFNHRSNKDIFYIGNIHETSILEAFNSEAALAIKKRFITFNPPLECRKCSMYF